MKFLIVEPSPLPILIPLGPKLKLARMEEGRIAFKILTGKLTGERPLGRPGHSGKNILEWTLKK